MPQCRRTIALKPKIKSNVHPFGKKRTISIYWIASRRIPLRQSTEFFLKAVERRFSVLIAADHRESRATNAVFSRSLFSRTFWLVYVFPLLRTNIIASVIYGGIHNKPCPQLQGILYISACIVYDVMHVPCHGRFEPWRSALPILFESLKAASFFGFFLIAELCSTCVFRAISIWCMCVWLVGFVQKPTVELALYHL